MHSISPSESMKDPFDHQTAAVNAGLIARLITEQCADILAVLGLDGEPIFVNRAFTIRTGYHLAELHGSTLLELVHPLDRSFAQAAWDDVVSGKGHQTKEYRLQTKTGRALWVSGTLTPLVDGEGGLTAIAARHCDRSENRQHILLPRPEHPWFQLLFEKAAEGIAAVNRAGQILFANEAAARNLGYTLPELLLLSITDIEAKEDRAAFEQHYEDLLRGERLRFKTQHRRKDGSLADVEVSLNLFEHNGERISFSFWRDISECTRMESALRQSEERFRTIVESANDGILIADTETRMFIEANRRMCDMLGYTREELLSLDIADIHPPEDLPDVFAGFVRAVQNNEQTTQRHPVLRKNGTVFHAEIGHTTITLNGRTCAAGIFRDVTEQKRAEDSLRRSEQTHRTLAENIPGIVYRVQPGPPYHVRFFNRMHSVMLGATDADWISQGPCAVEPFIPPSERERVSGEILLAVSMKQPYVVEYPVEPANRGPRYVADRGTPVFDEQGRLAYIDGVVFDVTNQKRSEQALRESEERFRDIVGASGEFVWEVDSSGKFIYLSARVEAVTGFRAEDLMGRTPIDAFRPEGAGRVRSAFMDIARLGACIAGLEQRIVHASGGSRILRINGVPIIRNGVVLGYRGTAHDVTEQRQMADAMEQYRFALEESVEARTNELQMTIERLVSEIDVRRAAEQELELSRTLLQSILNSIQDPIMVLDRNLHVLLVNIAFRTRFLKGKGDLVLEGTCHEIFYGTTPSCNDCLSRTAMKTGKTARRVVRWGNDGPAATWYEICVFPLATAAGELIGSVHHMRDISDRKDAEEKIAAYQRHLRAYSQQLISTEERERRKIAQALHDGIPQKLALSKIFLQKLLDDPDNAARDSLRERIFSLYEEMTQEMRTLTFELSPPVLHEVGLEPALERLLACTLSNTQMTWKFENRRTGPPIKGERATILYSMLRELVINAIKYADARHLTITLDQSDSTILAVVQDDGKGMPPGAAQGGTGLSELQGFGLFSVRERLRRLGGQLTISSGPTQGTIVRIELPRENHEPKDP